MIIKRTVKAGDLTLNYEAVLQGEVSNDFTGCVVVHDQLMKGGRLRGFLVPVGGNIPPDHVVITRIALKQ